MQHRSDTLRFALRARGCAIVGMMALLSACPEEKSSKAEAGDAGGGQNTDDQTGGGDGGGGSGMQPADADAGGEVPSGDGGAMEPGEIPEEGGAILTINSGNGEELLPGESYVMPLATSFDGTVFAGLYQPVIEDESSSPQLVTVWHTFAYRGPNGGAVLNEAGEYESIWMQLQEFPLAVGSYLCQGNAPIGDPDSKIRVELSHEWINLETRSPRGTDSLVSTENLAGTTNCQLEITAVDGTHFEGKVTASLRNYAGTVAQLVGITYEFKLPLPVCSALDPQEASCFPWAK